MISDTFVYTHMHSCCRVMRSIATLELLTNSLKVVVISERVPVVWEYVGTTLITGASGTMVKTTVTDNIIRFLV